MLFEWTVFVIAMLLSCSLGFVAGAVWAMYWSTQDDDDGGPYGPHPRWYEDR